MSVKKIAHSCARIIIIGFATYILFGLFLFVCQRSYIYYPDKTPTSDCSDTDFAGAEMISYGSVRGYLANKEADSIVVFYHGNAGRACDRLFLAHNFTRHDKAVFFVEYTGYGEKEASPSIDNLLRNVRDAAGFVRENGYRDVWVVGESLGSGPAAYHASIAEVSKAIFISPYSSLTDVAARHFSFFPVGILLRDNYTPAEWLKDYSGEIAIIIAENDEVIPVEISYRFFEKIYSTSTQLRIILGVDHNSLYTHPDFYDALGLFMSGADYGYNDSI